MVWHDVCKKLSYICVHDKEPVKCTDNDVEQRAQPKTNYAGWRGFSTLLYSPWQRAVQWGWKGPSSHQTAPKKERSPAAVQLMHTQGMCLTSTHCHTLLPCFGDGCTNTMLLYTQKLLHTAGCLSVLWCVFFRSQNLNEICLMSWLTINDSIYKFCTKTSMKSSVLPSSVFESAQHVLSPLIAWVWVASSSASWLRTCFFSKTLWTGELSAAELQ